MWVDQILRDGENVTIPLVTSRHLKVGPGGGGGLVGMGCRNGRFQNPVSAKIEPRTPKLWNTGGPGKNCEAMHSSIFSHLIIRKRGVN